MEPGMVNGGSVRDPLFRIIFSEPIPTGFDDFGQRAQFRIQITPVIQSLIKNPIFGK
jgi:hypothetical protein